MIVGVYAGGGGSRSGGGGNKKVEGQWILTVNHSASRFKDAIFVESVSPNMYTLTVAPGPENRFSSEVSKLFLIFYSQRLR